MRRRGEPHRPRSTMEDTAPPDVDVVSRKGLGEAKAYKVLKKFLKKDSEKPVNDQVRMMMLNCVMATMTILLVLEPSRSLVAASNKPKFAVVSCWWMEPMSLTPV